MEVDAGVADYQPGRPHRTAKPAFDDRHGDETVKRVAFLLQLKKGTGEAYDRSHQAVWPEMLALLKSAGVAEYSIFRRDELLVLVMHVEDFEATWTRIEADPVNLRWQTAMGEYFEEVQPTAPGERFPFLQEVFYLP